MSTKKEQQTTPVAASGERQRRQLVLADVERMRVPRRYWKASWDLVLPLDAEHREAVGRYMRSIVANVKKGWGLHLWGPNDTGKTAVSCLVLMEARRWGFSGLFVRSPKLRQVIINSQKFDDSHSWLQRAERVDVLVIDDLGKEYRGDSSFAERMIEGLIRERQGSNKVTILTTNLAGRSHGSKGESLEDMYQESMLRVMKASIYPQPVKGHNYREAEEAELRSAMTPG
jgi:DNA replication protein DnaC